MLPLGRKQALKCKECGISAHKECHHMVPDFCGFPPKLLQQYKHTMVENEKKKQLKEVERTETQRQTEHWKKQFPTLPPIGELLNKQNRTSAPPSRPPPQLPQPIQSQQPLPPHLQQQQQQQIDTSVPIPPIATVYDKDRPQSPSSPHQRYRKSRGIGLDDFKFLSVLGKGNFGKVILAEERYSSNLYAIKILKKEFIIENDEVESTRSEKRVFQYATRELHPFLVNLHSCFQTESRIYFVMEYVSGGDLMWHIQQQQFSKKRAKFYACEVLMALEYLHRQNIIYR